MIARLPIRPTHPRRHPRCLLVLIPSLVATVALHGQGALLPPSDPAPTMKTLDQLEPRTIVNAINTPGDSENSFIIRSSGSYYLTGNITGDPAKHGISIQANGVTLDLNGFALIGPGAPQLYVAGIDIPVATPRTSICIRNGSVRQWNGGGVMATAAGALVEKLMLDGNRTGLSLSNGSLVRDCVATGNETGFKGGDRTQFVNCIATVNALVGFECTSFVNLVDCTSSRNGGVGIKVQASCSVSRCTSTRNTEEGISTQGSCTITDCTANSNGTYGIKAGLGTTIRNCTASGNSNHGIYCFENNCHVVGNTCDQNYEGIQGGDRVEGNSCSGNLAQGYYGCGLLIRNSAHGNSARFGTLDPVSANYGLPGAHGPFVDMSAGGSIPAGTSPLANIIY